MVDSRPITREEALRAEAENYLARLKHRMLAIQTRRERASEALAQREEWCQKQAESYLFDLTLRANFRDNVRTRAQQEKEAQAEFLKRQGELYRQRLRRFLRPEELEDVEANPDLA
jgi:alpha-galactosidase